MANTAIANDFDQELFSELEEPLVQPLLIHMVAPFVNGDDKNFSLQINGKILKGWKKLEGNLKKLFAALQANLHSIGYILEESAFDRVANLLNTTTNNCTSSDCNQPPYNLKWYMRTLNPLYRIFLWLLHTRIANLCFSGLYSVWALLRNVNLLTRRFGLYKELVKKYRGWGGGGGWIGAFGNVVDKKHMTHPLPSAQKWLTHS